MPVALITGITGQDGSYLAELLLAKGYCVVGAVRDLGKATEALSATLANQVDLVAWDMADWQGMAAVLARFRPRKVAAYSSGAGS